VARVFITGSSDGLGLTAARLLIDQGHEVVLHGRNEARSRGALAAAPGARGVISGTSPPSLGQENLPTRSTSLAVSTPSSTMRASVIARAGWRPSPEFQASLL
jgi:NAD(P)-dependent dehydrogenase (short-subunit alcohol dehydrogenase family)